MGTRNRGLGVAIGAMVILALILPAVAVAKSSGSIRTTSDAACDPQNANTYGSGDWVYLAGKDFDANAAFTWTIEGLPGGASADPGVSVAQGAGTTDSDGGFCFQAYQVASDDLGVYKATVVEGTASKSDNYTVEAVPVEDPITDPTDTGSDPADTGSDATDTGSDPADPGADAQQDIQPEPESVSDPADDTVSDPADDTTSDAVGDGSGPTQQVLGETSGPAAGGDAQLGAQTSSGSPQMPSTDTIETTGGTGPVSILIGLALIAGTAILFAPNHRRDVRA